MKKSGAILFTLFYLFMSVGITVSAHFCHDSLKSVNFYSGADHCCCEGEAATYSCCKDELFQVQLNDEHQAAQVAAPLLSIDHFPLQELFGAEPIFSERDSRPVAYYNKPPPKAEPTYILNCSLTYYG